MNKQTGPSMASDIALVCTGVVVGLFGAWFAMLMFVPDEQKPLPRSKHPLFTSDELAKLQALARRWQQAPAEIR